MGVEQVTNNGTSIYALSALSTVIRFIISDQLQFTSTNFYFIQGILLMTLHFSWYLPQKKNIMLSQL